MHGDDLAPVGEQMIRGLDLDPALLDDSAPLADALADEIDATVEQSSRNATPDADG